MTVSEFSLELGSDVPYPTTTACQFDRNMHKHLNFKWNYPELNENANVSNLPLYLSQYLHAERS